MSAGAETFLVELEREDDGRWLAEVPQLPGVLAYGYSQAEALAYARALAVTVLAGQAVLSPDPAGGFTVTCPELPGCVSQGETREEANANFREAVVVHVEFVHGCADGGMR